MHRHAWQLLSATLGLCLCAAAQQPPEPVDRTPQNGQAYDLMNQASGLQLVLSAGSVTQAARDLTAPAQRWALVRLDGGAWKLVSQSGGLCLAESLLPGAVHAETCGLSPLQHWQLTENANGYWTLEGAWPGWLLSATTANGVGIARGESANPNQSELWQLRPAFWRASDTAQQEKMEALRLETGLPWWKDNEQPEDILKILKDHGFNAVRLRPTSIPPYYPDQNPDVCTGNYCYIQTDAQEHDFARRARDLGMSLELTLFYDGGSSYSVPGSWAGESLQQLQTSVYNYTKEEIESFRKDGLMPDLVSIGNEVDTGFLGFYPYNNYASFAALEKAGLAAVADAASDPTLGPPLPAPLTCIHITPGYNLTSFFQSANAAGLNYDAICQSYYPIYHGPLTDAQAAAANPSHQPVETDVLSQAALNLKKPIYIIETAEHYENGFLANDPWYPPTPVGQRRFLLDLESTLHSTLGNLAMGMEYWAPNDVQMPDGQGPYRTFQSDYTLPTALFSWAGLALFDSADPGYLTDPSAPNYSTALPGLDAVGGKEDATLRYQFVNRASSLLLGASGSRVGTRLFSVLSGLDGAVNVHEQWQIAGNSAGAFTITNLAEQAFGSGVLDGSGGTSVQLSAGNGSTGQSWDVQTAGDGYYYLVNQQTSAALADSGARGATETPLNSSGPDAEWAIVPVAISTGH